jgi:hypothetical protein
VSDLLIETAASAEPAPPATPAPRRYVLTDARRIPLPVLLALLWALFPSVAWTAEPDQDITVHVDKDGPTISVYVDCPVTAPALLVWSVLTD